MPEYIYKASDRGGKVMEGSFEAADQAAVVARIRGMGYIPIRIEQAGRGRQAPGRRNINLNIDLKPFPSRSKAFPATSCLPLPRSSQPLSRPACPLTAACP